MVLDLSCLMPILREGQLTRRGVIRGALIEPMTSHSLECTPGHIYGQQHTGVEIYRKHLESICGTSDTPDETSVL
jgi:hypothetical protein